MTVLTKLPSFPTVAAFWLFCMSPFLIGTWGRPMYRFEFRMTAGAVLIGWALIAWEAW